MIEIMDLEANFLRAPLTLVLTQIRKSVTSYIKHISQRKTT